AARAARSRRPAGRGARRAHRPARPAGAVRGDRRAEHPRLLGAVPRAARAGRGVRGQPARARPHRDRQHGGQPAPDVRRARDRGRRHPPAAGPARVRARPRPDHRRAGRPAHVAARRGPGRRAAGADRRHRGRHRAAVRRLPLLDLPLPRHAPGRTRPSGDHAMTATLAPAHPLPSPPPARPRRGRAEVVALAVLLAGTAALYLWNLAGVGWGNPYYSGAVRAMTQNWTAFFFGSTDAGNTVTVDKPPAALWVTALSARIFGLSPWSVLVPQALMGVGAVALLHAAVRRVTGPWAALLAAGVFALTPVTVLMFRHNNPDALLVLLLVAAAYATVRAIERASTRWIVFAGALVGAAFLVKMLQAFVVLPALALAYLVAAPTGVWRRIRQLVAAGAAVVAAAGWWVAAAELWPAGSRPYIGGSENNSVLDLAFGHNGLFRLLGRSADGHAQQPVAVVVSPRGTGVVNGFGGPAGWTRLFGPEVGGQASWLLPAALALLVVGLVLTWRAPRTDRVRASLLLWGGWTVVTAVVFSFAQGPFHPYYTVALAPGVAALVGIGGEQLWRRRAAWQARLGLAGLVAGTAAWAVVLLGRTPDFAPGLRWVVIAAAAVAVPALLAGPWARRTAVVAGLAALLAGG